jgi:hypothetical protein
MSKQVMTPSEFGSSSLFFLMWRYGMRAVIPIEDVCRDYFSHLEPAKLVEKIRAGEIRLPLVRMEDSQKSAKGIPVNDFAAYLDSQISAARRDLEELTRT